MSKGNAFLRVRVDLTARRTWKLERRVICIMRGHFIGFHDVFPSVDRINFAIESRQMKLEGGPPLGHATV